MAEMCGSAHLSHCLSAAAGEYVSTVQGEMIKTLSERAAAAPPVCHLICSRQFMPLLFLFLIFLSHSLS